MKPKVYLAGKMEGLTWEEASGWRRDLMRYSLSGFEVLDPMRGKNRHAWAGPKTSVFFHHDAIITRDLNDIERSDVVIAHFNTGVIHGVGTFIELGTCIPLRKPVILIIAPESALRQHPFISRFPRSIIVSSCAEAVTILYSMFCLE